jgi:hypothetical protein
MKAIFNNKREVIAIGNNIYNAENRSDFIEITEGNIPKREELIKWGVRVYTIDTKGKITKRTDATIKNQPAYNEFQENQRKLEYREKTDDVAIEALWELIDNNIDNLSDDIKTKVNNAKAEKHNIKSKYVYNKEEE